MQQYSTYKPTNIEWLGDVPSHWKIDKLKNHCEIFASGVDKKIDETEIEVALCNYVDVYKNDVINKSIEFMMATATPSEIEKFTLQLNDIVLTKDSETPNDIAVPAIVKEVFDNFLCGYHLSIIRCNRQIEPDFLIWVLRDLQIATQFHREAVGITRFGLASKHFKNGIITFPSKAEQTAIANYLDQATAQIDSVIATKQQQLQTLEQYKKSKIHECVTKGLNPNAPLKPSGIEWIGDVPEHWKVEKFKRLLKEPLKYGANESGEFEDRNHPRYIRITDFQNDGTLKSDTFKSLPPDVASNYLLNEGDLLFARSGATSGKVFLFKNYNGSACFAGYLIKAVCDEARLNYNFIFYYTQSTAYETWKNMIFTQSTIQNISAEKYALLPVPCPKINEQNEIVAYIDSLCEKLSNEKDIIEQQIATLQQYRKSLIHECVTGKRKVIN